MCFSGLNLSNQKSCIDNPWLVVSIPLKNISQWEGLSHILWKIKTVSSGYVKIAIENGDLVRGFTHENSMVDLSIAKCKRLPEGNP